MVCEFWEAQFDIRKVVHSVKQTERTTLFNGVNYNESSCLTDFPHPLA